MSSGGDAVDESTETTASTESGEDDPIRDFAGELRRLRLDAGSPTLVNLQHRTGISRSVLSDAFAGRTLPTERTVSALVSALDEDPEALLRRRRALARAARESDAATTPSGETPAARTVTRRNAALLSVAAFTVGVLGTLGGVAVVSAVTAPRIGEPQITVANGVDPATTPCIDDAAVATSDTRAGDSLLEIIWSDKCQAGWGRLTRYDAQGAGNTVTIAIYPLTAPTGPLRMEATEHDVQGAYTPLIVRPTPDTLLCAEGDYTLNGRTVDLGGPLCI